MKKGGAAADRAFLASLRRLARQRVDYFELCRRALGPGSPAVGRKSYVDLQTLESPLYRRARDIVTKAGIAQGLILAPGHPAPRPGALSLRSPLSVAQAAELIGVSRMAVYKAIRVGRLEAVRIGNVRVVPKAAAEAFRRARAARA